MVHSVAVSGGAVFAAHNGLLVKYEGRGQPTHTVADADLAQLRAAGPYIVGTVASAKQVRVYAGEDLRLVATHELPKRPSALAANADTGDLFVADKFGDVFHADLLSPTDAKQLPTVLGHVSMVMDLDLPAGHIISSDRDEHIRVSRLPDAFVIERFLLGHTAFVSHLARHNDVLVSAGGDPFVTAWNWRTGEQLARLDVGGPVIALAIVGDTVHIAREHCPRVVTAALPTLQRGADLDVGADVTSLAAGAAEVVVGLADRVRGYDPLPGPPTAPVSEEQFRKNHAGV